jgi:hypothetical protein
MSKLVDAVMEMAREDGWMVRSVNLSNARREDQIRVAVLLETVKGEKLFLEIFGSDMSDELARQMMDHQMASRKELD